MKPRARLAAGLGALGLLALTAFAAVALRTRSSLEELRAWAQAEGFAVEAASVERGLFANTLRDVRARAEGGLVATAREATMPRWPGRGPRLRAPALTITLAGDPFEAFTRVTPLRASREGNVEVAQVAVDYRHVSLGALGLDGVTTRAGGPPLALHADTLRLGGMRFQDVPFSVSTRNRTLEVLLGTAPTSFPRATATYVRSDGRASEWRIFVPHQALGALRVAVGLGAPGPEDAQRVAGTLSWITPDQSAHRPRGTCRFVMDDWFQPPWPEAKALVGSSGALSAALVPNAGGEGLRLERVEVAAALFQLHGAGTLTFGEVPKVTLAAAGRRRCGELARGLPPSRHRERVQAYLAAAPPSGTPGATPEGGRAAEQVELSLEVELTFGPSGAIEFQWQLGPGCGLEPMRRP